MSTRIRYMGNKREMASDVALLVDELRPGRPLLDLFCGMCFVAGAVAPSRRVVWVNDIQHYSALAARCLVGAEQSPPSATALVELLEPAVRRNREKLASRFSQELCEEEAVLAAPNVVGYRAAYAKWRHAANCTLVAREIASLSANPRRTPYRLCTLTFAWGYFGLRQAIDLDSLRYAMDHHYRRGDLSACEHQWGLLAFIQASSRIATAPGHLSQYLSASTEKSLIRVVQLRRRSAVEQFSREISLLLPYGDGDWRANNKVIRADAIRIWRSLARRGFGKAVVYADPPYSKNQYSRFYHVLETLTRYDYPQAFGRGRYRPDRFKTPFSTATGVAGAFNTLARGVAATGSALVLSYPSDGMLTRHGDTTPSGILGRHFGSVSLVLRRPGRHSTLGARHGDASDRVEELVYLAK